MFQCYYSSGLAKILLLLTSNLKNMFFNYQEPNFCVLSSK